MRTVSGEEMARRCLDLFDGEGGGEDEGRGRILARLAQLFADLAVREDFLRACPRFGGLFDSCVAGLAAGLPDAVEESVTMIYAYLHGAGGSYSDEERRALDEAGGYWCHAGGLSPLWRASPWIGPSTRVADYGAGNGLQGLLLQHLYPHRRTTLIELSGEMVRRGRELQALTGIGDERVEWVHGSVADVPPDRFDFIYIYRPLRPEGEAGRVFYRDFAGVLDEADHEVTIFSVADCLKDFLGPSYRAFYDDGQLTCFTNRPERPAAVP